ncbi:Pr6Pr family membrane protein [Pseudomonas sp. MWU12-2037]|uniref:Pr6Pr family membrane protein n=1 Tax=Pseudomonas sp. MWU12-2037 TaxID=2928690 RepID=UPI0032C4702A
MILVALVYNLLLRVPLSFQEFQWVPDELMHDVMPMLFLLYWWFCAPRGGLLWRDALPWLIYLLVYCVYLLVRGYLIGAYPYDFIDVGELGYPRMFINAGLVVLVFVLLSVLLIAVDRWRGRR